MDKLIQYKYDTSTKNSIDMYDNLKKYLFDVEENPQFYKENIIDVLREITDLSLKIETECGGKYVNLIQKAIDDFLSRQKERLGDTGYVLKRNFYKKNVYAQDDWIWSSKNWCEIQIENYTDHNGLCNVSFILSVPVSDNEELFDIYLDDILYRHDVHQNVLVTLDIPMGKLQKKSLKIIKKKNTCFHVAEDERDLYFCIKELETDFQIKTGIEYNFEYNFSQKRWNGEWIWSFSKNGEIDIINYSTQNGILEIWLILGLPTEKNQDFFDIYVDKHLVACDIKKDTYVQIREPICNMERKRLSIVKSSSEYGTASNDERQLFFCIKDLKTQFIPKTGIECIYEDGFYESCGDWKWAGASRGEISLFNCNDDNGVCLCSMTIDGMEGEKCSFNVYIDERVLKKNVLSGQKTFFIIPIGSSQHSRIRIDKSNSQYGSVNGDNRKLYFCIKEFNIQFVSKSGVEITFEDGFYETNDEWHWASKNTAQITIKNYCKEPSLINLSLAMEVLCDSEQPEFEIFDDNGLILWGIKKNEQAYLKFYMNPVTSKTIYLKKDSNSFSYAENDNRKLFFCVSKYKLDVNPNKKLVIEYDDSFYGIESNGQQMWNWSSGKSCVIEIENFSPDNELCRVSFQLETVCKCSDIRFSIYLEDNKIVENMTTGLPVEVEFPIHANQKRQLKIDAINIEVTKIPSDDRELTFSVYNLSTELIRNNSSDFTRDTKPYSDNKKSVDNNIEYTNVLYRRLKWMNNKKVLNRFIGGITLEGDYNANRKEIRSAIDSHDVISFDLFDTLLTRKVLYPEDVFEILESKSEIAKTKTTHLAEVRKNVQATIEHATLIEIYNKIGEYYQLSATQMQDLMNLEIAIEMDVLIPRNDMIALFEYAVNAGKSIYIVSDMYISKEIIEKILNKNNITGYKEIMVSCDYRKTKREGLLSDLVKKEENKSILHIGNDLDIDVYSAAVAGIDSYYVKSGVDMYISSVYGGDLLGIATTCNERSLLGLLISELYNSPFIDQNISMEKAAYCFFAPIITSFMTWLWRCIDEGEYKGVLFAARDGYLIHRLYLIMQEKLGNNNVEGIYFLTSRAAASAAGLTCKERVLWLADVYKNMNVNEVLTNRFGFSEEDISNIEFSSQSIQDIAENCTETLVAQSEKLRENYREYVKSLNLIDNGKYAFFDFVSGGTCQLLLSSILDLEIEGTYFCRNYAGDVERQNLIINSFMQNLDSDNVSTFFFSVYKYFELFITSCNPALLYFADGGIPVYDFEKRSKMQLDMIEKIQHVIEQFFRTYIHTLYIQTDNIRAEFADDLLQMIDKQPFSTNMFKNKECALVDDWINNIISFNSIL